MPRSITLLRIVAGFLLVGSLVFVLYAKPDPAYSARLLLLIALMAVVLAAALAGIASIAESAHRAAEELALIRERLTSGD